MDARGTVAFGLALASLVAALPHAVSALYGAWGAVGPAATGLAAWFILFVEAVCAYTLAAGEDPPTCACTQGWTPLDARWRRFRDAASRCADAPTPLGISASVAALGHLAVWFAGRERARIPLDEEWRAAAADNYARHGCVRGRGALIPLIRLARGGAPSEVDWLCPTRIARNPLGFTRVWRDLS